METETRYVPKVGDLVTSPWLVGVWKVVNAPPAEAKHTKTTIESDDGTATLLILWKDLEPWPKKITNSREDMRERICRLAEEQARAFALQRHMSLNCWDMYIAGREDENFHCVGAERSDACLSPAHDHRFKE